MAQKLGLLIKSNKKNCVIIRFFNMNEDVDELPLAANYKTKAWLARFFDNRAGADLGLDLARPDTRYVILCREICPHTGRAHFHCYIEFINRKTRDAAKRWLGRPDANCVPRRGTPLETSSYCKKDGEFWEHGELPPEPAQGKRSDLLAVTEAIKEGKTAEEIFELYPVCYLRMKRNIDAILLERQEPQIREVSVYVFVRNTAIGKTHWAHKLWPGLWMHSYSNENRFFNQYRGQSTILFDEFSGQIPLENMNRICDKFPMWVEVKGAAMPAAWTTVVICSNLNVADWWNLVGFRAQSMLPAFQRRINATISGYTREEFEAHIQEQFFMQNEPQE